MLTISYDTEHLFILRGGDIGHEQVDRLFHTLCFATDAVDSARTLFESRRIPTEIMVDYVPAVQVQVDTFGHHATYDQNLREQGRVELCDLEVLRR